MTPLAELPVVIFCGGEGTRLSEETQHQPKPLLNIGSEPIFVHIMRIYATHGFRRFILCLGYRGNLIKEHFLNYDVRRRDIRLNLATGGKEFLSEGLTNDWDVIFAETGEKSQTVARLARIARYVDTEHFLCTYGDGLANVDLVSLVKFHLDHGCIGTMTGIETFSQFGLLRTDDTKVIGFEEKPRIPGLINGGFFVFRKAFFDYVSDEPGCILEREPLEKLTREGQLHVFRHSGFWQCMDTFKDYKLLNEMWARGQAPRTVRN